jgi:hypothetical protein
MRRRTPTRTASRAHVAAGIALLLVGCSPQSRSDPAAARSDSLAQAARDSVQAESLYVARRSTGSENPRLIAEITPAFEQREYSVPESLRWLPARGIRMRSTRETPEFMAHARTPGFGFVWSGDSTYAVDTYFTRGFDDAQGHYSSRSNPAITLFDFRSDRRQVLDPADPGDPQFQGAMWSGPRRVVITMYFRMGRTLAHGVRIYDLDHQVCFEGLAPPAHAYIPPIPVPLSDPSVRVLMRALRDPLRSWVSWWRKDVPGFTLDSLQWFDLGRFTPGGWPGVDTASVKLEWNPARTYAVDWDVYAWWDSAAQHVEFGEPHAIAALYDVRSGRTTSLDSFGPKNDALWLDDSRFVLMGWSFKESGPRPNVHIVDLERREVIAGYGPPARDRTIRSSPTYRDERLARRARERASGR